MITNLFDIDEMHRGMNHNISITTVQKITKYKTGNNGFKTCVLRTLALAVKSEGVDRSQRNKFADRTLSVLKILACYDGNQKYIIEPANHLKSCCHGNEH